MESQPVKEPIPIRIYDLDEALLAIALVVVPVVIVILGAVTAFLVPWP